MNVDQLLQAVSGKGSMIGRVFELVGIAQEEVDAAARRTRDKAERARIRGAWRLAYPGILLRLEERLYRHHCRELIERVRLEQDTRPATRAEVLAHLSRMSLVAPPGAQWAALQEDLFEIIFARRLDGPPIREPWPQASAELLSTLRNMYRVEGRQ